MPIGFNSYDSYLNSRFETVRDTPVSKPMDLGPGLRARDGLYLLSRGYQPDTETDISNPKLKEDLLGPSQRIGADNRFGPRQKIEQIENLIGSRLTHAGNDPNFATNPNRYTEFIEQRRGSTAKMSEFWEMRYATCREFAWFMLMSLQAAGCYEDFTVVRGHISLANGREGTHNLCAVKLPDERGVMDWFIVDPRDPRNNWIPLRPETRLANGMILRLDPGGVELGQPGQRDWSWGGGMSNFRDGLD